MVGWCPLVTSQEWEPREGEGRTQATKKTKPKAMQFYRNQGGDMHDMQQDDMITRQKGKRGLGVTLGMLHFAKPAQEEGGGREVAARVGGKGWAAPLPPPLFI